MANIGNNPADGLLNIALPNINGAFEVGIAVGNDPTLPEVKKLPIYQAGDATRQRSYANAVSWAMRNDAFPEGNVKKLIVNGIAALFISGAVQEANGMPDGDWYAVANTGEAAVVPEGYITEDGVRRAATLIVATKANFWLMNQHTGQGQVQGYVKKVLELQYPQQVDDRLVSAVHTLGRWASSRYILAIGGVTGLVATVDAIPIPAADFSRLLAKSTLAKSAHMTRERVESYDDYSPEWAIACDQAKAAALSRQGAVMEFIQNRIGAIDEDARARAIAQFFG